MSPHPNVYARLERVKALWVEISNTPQKSRRYKMLVEAIRAEAVAYLAGVDADISADRRRKKADRRQQGLDPTELRAERRQRERRR